MFFNMNSKSDAIFGTFDPLSFEPKPDLQGRTGISSKQYSGRATTYRLHQIHRHFCFSVS